MNPTVKNILAIVAGCIGGGILNMLIITYGPVLIPAPPGVDPNDLESINANAHLYELKHMITPFLAHAIGTLFGAYVATRLAASHHMKLALVVGVFFLIGGIAAASMIKISTAFSAFDILFAYIPMAYLGWKLGATVTEDTLS